MSYIVVQNSGIITPAYAAATPGTIASPVPQSFQDVCIEWHTITKYNPIPVCIVEEPDKKVEDTNKKGDGHSVDKKTIPIESS